MNDTLSRWFDPGLPPSSLPKLAAAIPGPHARRLSELAYCALLASTIPRRLGGEASSAKLREDKRICRAVAHSSQTLSSLWQPDYPIGIISNNRDNAVFAAQIQWIKWWSEQQQFLNAARSSMATWAIRSEHEAEGNRFVSLLTREEQELVRIFGMPPISK